MISGRRSIFFSTLTYELSRQLGNQQAAAELVEQCRTPTKTSLPVARMVYRVSQWHDVQLYHGAGSYLPKARSRAAHAALQSGADYWLMCDDDVECDARAIETLLRCSMYDDRVAVGLPCWLRGARESEQINVQWDGDLVLGGTRKAKRIGTGCLMLSRVALQEVTDMCNPALAWDDDDEQRKVALFRDLAWQNHETRRQEWLGEDFSFCHRLRDAGVELRGVVEGVSRHAGEALQLDSLR